MAKLIDITGKAISGEWGTDDLVGNGVPVLRTTNFTNIGVVNFNNVVTRQIVKKSISEKLLRYGDIIIEKSGGSDKQPVGRVVFFEGENNKYLFNNFIGLLRVRDFCKWNPKYIFYSLFSNYAKGGTIPFENRTTGLHNLQTDSYVNSVMIVERKIEEQTDIVTILDKVNQLINYEKKQLEDLDILVKSRFIEMFGDPITNTKRWPADKVEAVCSNIYGGGTPSKSKEEYWNGDIPWISSKDMKSDMISDSQIRITNLGLDNSSAKLVPINSVIMVIRSGILKHTLPVAINTVPVTVNQDLKVFIPSASIHYRFLAFLFKMLEKDILAGVRAVTADNIEFDTLKNRKIILPPVQLQNQFASFVTQVDKSKLAIQKSLDELETLKKSLMQQYFG